MENTEIIFATGMNFKSRHEKAPESVRGTIYFNVAKFKKFLDENADEKGFVTTKMMKSMTKGSIYFILDTWKPVKDPIATQEYNDTKYKVEHKTSPTAEFPEGIDMYNHPLTTDAEREEMEAEQALKEMDNIPF